MPAQPATAKRVLVEVVAIILLAFAMVVVARLVAVDVRVIPSGSMLPQLQLNDRVLVSRLSYVYREPNRGDIVVFPPGYGTEEDGRPAVEDDVSFFLRPLRDIGRWLHLVDPPQQEQDFIKRVIGLPGETVEGRDGAVFVNGRRLVEPYLPPGVFTSDFDPVAIPQGGLWVMGDNRENSKDSRFLCNSRPTFIQEREVIGRAFVRVWPVTRWGRM
ncbi:MAG: signal peptidase I [Actinobacteria bacterium]|nr:signal peptidase I [Actinomycetota bacterium]